jgi:hypothetical protein
MARLGLAIHKFFGKRHIFSQLKGAARSAEPDTRGCQGQALA